MTKSTSALVWLGKMREKEVLDLASKHMEKVVGTVEAMRENIHAFCDLDEKRSARMMKETARREREADDVKEKIIEDLSKGMFHPIDRGEIMQLLLTADDIATYAEATTRRLAFLPAKKVDKSIMADLKDTSDTLVQMTKLLKTALGALSEGPGKVIELTESVERLEEKIDKLRVEKILPKVLKWCDKSKRISHSLMLKDMVDHLEDVADKCEDAADVIRHIAVSAATR